MSTTSNVSGSGRSSRTPRNVVRASVSPVSNSGGLPVKPLDAIEELVSVESVPHSGSPGDSKSLHSVLAAHGRVIGDGRQSSLEGLRRKNAPSIHAFAQSRYDHAPLECPESTRVVLGNKQARGVRSRVDGRDSHVSTSTHGMRQSGQPASARVRAPTGLGGSANS